jgi:hypothetical protein
MTDILTEREPGIRYRCGLIADRYELYAIPLPDCLERALIISVDRKDKRMRRFLHGCLPVSQGTCDQSAQIAVRQFGLNDPSWET